MESITAGAKNIVVERKIRDPLGCSLNGDIRRARAHNESGIVVNENVMRPIDAARLKRDNAE